MSRRSFDDPVEANRAGCLTPQDQLRGDYAGQYIARACGKVVGSGRNHDEAFAAVQRLDPAIELVLGGKAP
jgi:hypothetical protein